MQITGDNMKVDNILINQMKRPLGFNLNHLRITFEISDIENNKYPTYKAIEIGKSKASAPVYLIPWQRYYDNGFQVDMELSPRTSYWVKVKVKSGNHSAEAKTSFETGKMDESLLGEWIVNSDKKIENTLFKRDFCLEDGEEVVKARLYSTALGVYEVYLNGHKVGDEFLAPGFTAYNKWLQLQSYNVTSLLQSRTNEELLFSVGDGWYKGNLGFDGGENNIYGNQQGILAELHITYKDGSQKIIKTDKNWLTTSGKITKSSIYYGEDFDDCKKINEWRPVSILQNDTFNISDRLSLPIKKETVLKVKKVIQTPKHELVLDFGQNHAGWPVFYNRLPKGKKITLQMGEILQDGNFYRDNLRRARAAFTYVSNGQEKWIRPHFTYYGFRYVKVSGIKKVNPKDFVSWVLCSDLRQMGSIVTNNDKVNRLFENVMWGQKSNFVDIPTDCPQRDERLGWTGDAEIFASTASFNMNTCEFYKKYAKDMAIEQNNNDGMLTMFAPSLKQKNGGLAIWGDAATIIPWTVYRFYGDSGILKQNYRYMKAWVDWITTHTTSANLWTGHMQLGDWLALDNGNNPKGKTNDTYIASLYFALSAEIVSKTSRLLHYDYEADYYDNLARNIKARILNEFVTKNGRVAIDTQTALVLALQFKLILSNQKKHVIKDLVQKVRDNHKHLQTGFAGTPYLLPVLSANGQHHLAMDIFMQEDCPSWLYEVNQGATTIWERWNSVLPNGKMNPAGMNSLNHYSLGSVSSWLYQYVVGLEKFDPGFRKIIFAPHFDYRLKSIKASYQTSYGKIEIDYHIEANEQHLIKIKLNIPFGISLKVNLPRVPNHTITINGQSKINGCELKVGSYEIMYFPTKSYLNYFSLESTLNDILVNQDLVEKIDFVDPNILRKMKSPSNTKYMFINKSIGALLEFEEIPKTLKQKVENILSQEIKF